MNLTIMRKTALLVFPFVLIALVFGCTDDQHNKVVAFNPTSGELRAHLEVDIIPMWERLAEGAGCQFEILDDPERGIPAEIRSLPTLVYVHPGGQNVYYGRYDDEGRIKTWIRTGHRRVSDFSTDQRELAFSLQSGRMLEVAIPKITQLEGKTPTPEEKEQYTLLLESIADNMYELGLRNEVSIAQTDRKVFFDVYPYLSETGEWFLSLAIFSPFDCINAVRATDSYPIQGSYQQVVSASADWFEENWKEWKRGLNGDDYQPVAASATPSSWEELGLTVEGSGSQMVSLIPSPVNNWNSGSYPLAHKTYSYPELVFQFQSPLDGYAGALDSISGDFVWPTPPSLQGATGTFTVPVLAVNMGNEGLNMKVWEKYLKEKKYHEMRLELDPIEASASLAEGNPVMTTITGMMTILGKDRPVEILAEFRPVLTPDQQPALLVELQFDLDISQWKIEGPDGPDPASHTMEFAGTMLFTQS